VVDVVDRGHVPEPLADRFESDRDRLLGSAGYVRSVSV
jgi:hypothetical protein